MKPFLISAWFLVWPAAAFAQAAVAGTVTDASGAVVPGVTVVVSSPVLIEKSRGTVTDTAGRYRVEDLRPGRYSVRFTGQGWAPALREGIELTGSFTATVNVQLAIGEVSEAVTVTGALPVVDVRSAKQEVVLTGDLVQSIPVVRSYNALIVLLPGVVTNTNDIVTGTTTTSFPIHGGRTNEGRLAVDGLNVGSPPSGNSAASYVVDVGNADEITFLRAGGLGESETAGVVMNVVPRAGGNMTRGSVFASGTSGRLQGNNLTPALRDAGFSAATPLTRVYDFTGTLGGRISRDRIWYFVTAHSGGSAKESASVNYNLAAGDPTRWLYAPDANRREYSDRTFENASARITWQVTPRNRISAFWDEQRLCRSCTGATPGLAEPAQVSPEAVGVLGRPLRVTQVKWWSPISDRLFLEAGYGGSYFGVGNFERTPNPTRDLIRVVEQCAKGCAANGGIAGLTYRSQDFSVAHTGSYLLQGSLSYVTGAHVLKVGYQHTLMTDDRTWFTNSQNLTYRFNNGVPDQLTQSISPWVNNARVGWDGLFIQDQWTRSRLSVQAAVRFDRAHSWFPAQQEGPSRFLATPIVIPATAGVDNYKDISPRLGVAYDLRGDGRTAVKMNFGRYLEGAGVIGAYANTNPSLRLPQTTSTLGTAGVTRSWTDADNDFVPDCDLLNPAAQDLRGAGGDLCGVMSNTSFGKNVLTNNFDPALLNGWGVRPSDWNLGVSLQQQLGARSSVTASFIRRGFHGFSLVDNLALQSGDLTPYSVTAPQDPRLPGGGGYPIDGLYDVVPEKSGQVDNLVAGAGKYGRWSQDFTGIDVTVDMRIGAALTVSGGTSTGQTVSDNCDARSRLPELSTTVTGTAAFGAGLANSAVTPTSPYCHAASGVLTQVRGLASYLVPGIGVRVSATMQSRPGPMLAANYAVPNAAVVPSLGRDLSGNASTVTVNLVAPGSRYGNRINEVDLRVGKIFKSGRTRTQIAVDAYNLLNSSAILSYNTSFVPGGAWLQPISVLTPRLLRLTFELSF